jgi:hypothetical protein
MQPTFDDFIGVFPGAFDKDYCDAVIQSFEKAGNAGFLYTRQDTDNGMFSKTEKDDSQLMPSDFLNCQLFEELNSEFMTKFWDEYYQQYATTFGSLRHFDAHRIYFNKVQRTRKGQGYHNWHCENGDKHLANRVLAYILYLNDVEMGGETEFLYQSRRVQPETGTLVIFPAGFTHTHRGNPPLNGDKYIMTGWVEL